MPASGKCKTSTLPYPVDGDSNKTELNAENITALALQIGILKMPIQLNPAMAAFGKKLSLVELLANHFCQDMTELYANTKRSNYGFINPLIVLRKEQTLHPIYPGECHMHMLCGVISGYLKFM